ncbi:enolase C-terminal domain-like protein [Paracidobacterium acidisoli]|uniref:L-fuconate dehydratase n=1 Tax=Paracidobacterium acidisoli TaxID=2303751 RepID=A0A372IU28_9BACT|nr:enolase C-terminal domain-like protein [Paracidobacterium acidisoli]MBT9329874.1 fuconate dehydratase [Paracidobacterium acidisoli]
MSELKITDFRVIDLRFPTSREHIGSDAVNKDPDYSAAYCILETNHGLRGFGLTFTLGRGTELCVEALRYLAGFAKGRTLCSITDNFAAFSEVLTGETQFRWLGPEKGVIHLATAALLNAIWDLYARSEGKPLWKLLADMEPEQIAGAVDFRYISDALSREEAIELLRARRAGMEDRLAQLQKTGYPAYTTSAGWFGFSDEKISMLCDQALAEGWTHFKLKVGGNPPDDLRRARLMRSKIGPNRRLMMDANQKWGIEEAIVRTRELAEVNPWWMEEPTSPDDVLGHARIRREVPEVRIATGEHCQNRIMFKQFMQAEALDVCQIDSCRLAGVNENLAVILMAAKFGVPVCPHAGGVGLCEYVQHLSAFDYLRASATLENRVTEFVDHLHEHFIDPVRIRNAHYLLPEQPGYSSEIYSKTLQDYSFPDGRVWRK